MIVSSHHLSGQVNNHFGSLNHNFSNRRNYCYKFLFHNATSLFMLFFKIVPMIQKGPNLDKIWYSKTQSKYSRHLMTLNSQTKSAFGSFKGFSLTFPHTSFSPREIVWFLAMFLTLPNLFHISCQFSLQQNHGVYFVIKLTIKPRLQVWKD